MSVYEELNRRGVVRAAALYIAIAWGGTEIIVFLAQALWGEPVAKLAGRYLSILFIAGFPVAMYLAWTRDLGLQARRLVAAGALAAVLIGGLLWLVPDSPSEPVANLPAPVETNPRSIAVLPFVNMSSDEDNAWFSQGISEELLNLLARVPQLKVSSRTSSFHFAGRDIPLQEIAAQLGVRHILEGSVRRSGNRVRITAQLIDAGNDAHLWSETYDREVLDTFAVQDEIAGAIAAHLQIALNQHERRRPTESEEAYDMFLRGWHHIREGWSMDHLLSAQRYFEESIRLDPAYAQAHAMLSSALLTLGNFRYADPGEVFPLALNAAETALELDPESPEAHWAMGWLMLSYRFDRLAAEQSFRRAIQLAPGLSLAHSGLAFALSASGRMDEALEAAGIAFELDPMMMWTRSNLAEIHYKRHDFPATIKHTEAILEMQPDDPLALASMGSLYAYIGQQDKARELVGRSLAFGRSDPNIVLSNATTLALLQDFEQAKELLNEARSIGDQQYVAPGSLASYYATLGDSDQAVMWLERAVEVYDSYVFNLNYPDFDKIRDDPGFQALCARVDMDCRRHHPEP